MQLLVPFHADHALSTAGADLGFAALLALAGLGSALLVGVALAALVRRRSRSYLLVTLALATLLVRTVVGALLVTQSVDAAAHHWIEHGLDVVMAGLVVAAVYDARRVRGSADGGTDRDSSLRSDGGVQAADSRDARPRNDAQRGDEP